MEVEEDEIGEEETGWKLIVRCFRFPPFANGLVALLGAGACLCVTLLLLMRDIELYCAYETWCHSYSLDHSICMYSAH